MIANYNSLSNMEKLNADCDLLGDRALGEVVRLRMRHPMFRLTESLYVYVRENNQASSGFFMLRNWVGGREARECLAARDILSVEGANKID